MRNIKLVIQYEGTRYSGWQKQGNTENTIQARIENVLTEIAGEEICLIGASRTDAGVHADNQVANFKTKSKLEIAEIINYSNNSLPGDIVIKSAEDVGLNFHARLNSKGKKYIYYISNNKIYNDVFRRRFVCLIKDDLDFELMDKAAGLFIGEYDFKKLSKHKSKKKSSVRKITELTINRNGTDVELIYAGNGFLYKMIRMITAVIIMAGLNQISLDEIKLLLKGKDIDKEIIPAYPHGLVLKEVYY